MKRYQYLIVCVLAFIALMSDIRPVGAQTPKSKETKPQKPKPADTIPASPWQCDKGGPPSVTVAGGSIYWADFTAGNVWKVAVGGGNSTLVAGKQSGPCSVISRGDYIYWTNNKSGEVMRISINGGQATTAATGQKEPAEIVVSEDRIIWASANGPQMIEGKSDNVMKAAADDSSAGGGTNPGTVKCHVCPIYCRRWVPQIPNGYWETYICGWRSCPPCGA